MVMASALQKLGRSTAGGVLTLSRHMDIRKESGRREHSVLAERLPKLLCIGQIFVLNSWKGLTWKINT